MPSYEPLVGNAFGLSVKTDKVRAHVLWKTTRQGAPDGVGAPSKTT